MRARVRGSVPSKVLRVVAENRLSFLSAEMNIQEFRLYWYTARPPSFHNSTCAFCVQAKIFFLLNTITKQLLFPFLQRQIIYAMVKICLS